MATSEDLKKVDAVDGPEEEDDEEPKEPMHEFMWYLKPPNSYKIITTRWVHFTALAGIVYSYQLVLTISGVNNYCDITRLKPCGN